MIWCNKGLNWAFVNGDFKITRCLPSIAIQPGNNVHLFIGVCWPSKILSGSTVSSVEDRASRDVSCTLLNKQLLTRIYQYPPPSVPPPMSSDLSMDAAAECLIAWQPHPPSSPAATVLAAHHHTMRTLLTNVLGIQKHALRGRRSINTTPTQRIC